MLIDRTNCTQIHLTLYGPNILEPVTIYIRGDDQAEGTLTKYTIYNARRAVATKRGQAIFGEMSSDYHTTWHFSRYDLNLNGIKYINVLTMIVDSSNRWWQPESPDGITQKVDGGHVCVECVRIDPPANLVINEFPPIPGNPY